MKVFVFAVLFSVLAFGQTFQGTLRGRVLDPTGNPTSAAKVVITDEATQVSRATVSNDQGEYVFTAVNPATYTLSVELPGFNRALGLGVTKRNFALCSMTPSLVGWM
jgi:trimeric autotransporter adhesin